MAPLFFVVVIEARIGSNNPGLARTVYPVVGLYPVVKCKVVMLLVAGSSYTLRKSATKRSAAFSDPVIWIKCGRAA